MTGDADILALAGLGALVVALVRASGHRLFIVISSGTLLAVVACTALVGYVG